MIDAVVMADVKQQRLRRDSGFDLGEVLSELVHFSRAGDISKGRQQSPKCIAPRRLSFTRRLSSRRLRARMHARRTPFQRYKGVALRERESACCEALLSLGL